MTMVTAEARDLIRRLRLGEFDPGEVGLIAQSPASRFISDMMEIYPIAFQERRIGGKHEIGMARSLKFELDLRRSAGSLIPVVHMHPVLSRCLFVNSYGDSISGLTVAASVQVWPKGGPTKRAVLKMGRGYKLDRTPDGWEVKFLKGRSVILSETFLQKRGWKFESLRP